MSTSLVFSSALRELTLIDADASLFLLGSGEEGFLVFSADRVESHPSAVEQITKLRATLTRGRSGRPVLSGDPALIRCLLARSEYPNVAILPILIDDVLVGSLNVGLREQSSPEEMDALRDSARRLARALHASPPTDSVRKRNIQLNLINRLGRQDLWQMEMESYLDLAVVSIREGLEYYNVSIFTMDEDRSQLQLASHAGAYRGRVSRGFRQDIGVGMLGWVVRNGETRLANDVSKEPHYLAIEGLATASEICLPIIIEGQIEGVLNVESDRVDAYDEGDIVALEALAQQIADGIQIRLKNEAFDSLLAETDDRYRFGNLLGRSAGMRHVFELIQTVSGSDLPVLVRGETGTGKELVARAVHRESPRHDRAFVAVNCAALPETLFEDELFGHERGAFTGAERQRLGKIELAQGGTLFLDEVGEIPYPMQAKLLRAIAEKRISRVGGEKEIEVDVRIISATNRPQEELEREGAFRQDLYFRLNAVQIDIPSLRDRTDDIPLLAAYFLKEDGERYGKAIDRIEPDVMTRLMDHPWPGNVRELENVIGRAVLMENGKTLSQVELREAETKRESERHDLSFDESGSLEDASRRVTELVEQEYLRSVLLRTRGNLSESARQAGISRRTLYNKMEKYGMKREDYVPSS